MVQDYASMVSSGLKLPDPSTVFIIHDAFERKISAASDQNRNPPRPERSA